MKTSECLVPTGCLRAALAILAVLTAADVFADKPDYPGIWSIWGEPLTREGRPWYKGHVVTVDWRDIEPQPGKFDWTKLDTLIAECAGKDLYVMAMVYTGMKSPGWLYEHGVPPVDTDYRGESRYPYYLSPEFRQFFKRMITTLAEHLDRGLPPESRRKLIAVQCPVGASGDPHPYKVGAAERGTGQEGSFGTGATRIEPEPWMSYQKEMFRHYYDAFAQTSPRIHCLFNTIFDAELHAWALDAFPGLWVKTNRIGDRYQNAGEANPDSYQVTLPAVIRSFRNGRAIRARSEMDMTTHGWFKEAPVWNMYWTQLWGLHNGQDMHNQMEADLRKEIYYPAFAFYSEWAGYKDPRDSHGAWCALRDGLDYADVTRFPESAFGAVGGGDNRARYDAILAALAPFGAAQSSDGYVRRTNWRGMDDVGFQIHAGNFELYLQQIDPNGTSQGLWRVGPRDQPYGRFARRFDHASGKDAMHFRVEKGFFDAPLRGKYPIDVRIVYLDDGRGSWALHYDATGNPDKQALVVAKSGSGGWKEARVTLTDATFEQRGARGADLVLRNVDAEDDVFHMIEITRKAGDRKGHWGDE